MNKQEQEELKDGYYWHFGEDELDGYNDWVPVEIADGELYVLGYHQDAEKLEEWVGKFIPINPPETENKGEKVNDPM